jgi:hypothetical protein
MNELDSNYMISLKLGSIEEHQFNIELDDNLIQYQKIEQYPDAHYYFSKAGMFQRASKIYQNLINTSTEVNEPRNLITIIGNIIILSFVGIGVFIGGKFFIGIIIDGIQESEKMDIKFFFEMIIFILLTLIVIGVPFLWFIFSLKKFFLNTFVEKNKQ